MSDWLKKAFESPVVEWDQLAVRLLMALCLGSLITAIYHRTRYPTSGTATFSATLVLLCILIAMVTQVIGDNQARAFSLVGALSIVRFRTVVRDTKDTAFVIFAVVIGMAVGAGQPIGAICGLAVVGATAFLFRDVSRQMLMLDRDSLLTVRFNWTPELEQRTIDTASKYASEVEPISVVTVRHGTAMELAFRLRLLITAKPTELVADLNRIEGMQSVELEAHKPTT